MGKKTVLCKTCNAPLLIEPLVGKESHGLCSICHTESVYPSTDLNLEEIKFYELDKPYAFASILKEKASLKKIYHVLEPPLSSTEHEALEFLRKTLLERLTVRFNDIETDPKEYLTNEIKKILIDHEIRIDELVQKKLLYYIIRWFLGYDKIDPLMRDQYIEDISCDGAKTPVFVHHRDFGSLETNVIFESEKELSEFVVRLSQKCGKHISVAQPMLDATMADGSRIQMTLSSEITTKGSTFTIRRFRADPITPVDLIEYNTMSAQILAYLWMAVQHGANALIAGGTASGKTSILNAIALFIPREAKIVSIEETREINLPHSNWIPGITRSGLGETIGNQTLGEIDLYELMKAALRQRPEYILVGEIRGKEAYVLFQAMATGHTTYSTVHADSISSLIHRLEGRPINIPRILIQSLDIVLLQGIVKKEDTQVRRCKEIVEILSVDSETQEVLTNTVFRWDNKEDTFVYSGKSYLLENLCSQLNLTHDEMKHEIENRENILLWLRKHNLRVFLDVSHMVSSYNETPDDAMAQIKHPPKQKRTDVSKSSLLSKEDTITPVNETTEKSHNTSSEKKGFSKLFKKNFTMKKEV